MQSQAERRRLKNILTDMMLKTKFASFALRSPPERLALAKKRICL
jgi:hypothetical protein